MSILSRKPTTVTGVFEAAIADVKVIQENQKALQTKLLEEQNIRVENLSAAEKKLEDKKKSLQDKFKDQTCINSNSASDAEKEISMASKVIENFAKLFGISDAP